MIPIPILCDPLSILIRTKTLNPPKKKNKRKRHIDPEKE
jgi:hypothetical protein